MALYVFYGDETYLLQRELKTLRQQLIDPDMAVLCHKVLNNPSIGSLIETLGTPSFLMSGPLCIEIHGFTPLEKAVDDTDKKQLEILKESILDQQDAQNILFVNTKIDRKVQFPKWLCSVKGAITRDFKKLEFWKTDEAVQLVMQEAKHQGISIAPKAAMALVENLGLDIQLLMSEVQKLSLYARGRSILPDDVKLLSNHHENTFKMISLWIHQRNQSEIYTILDELLLKQHPLPLFGLMQTQVVGSFKMKYWQHLGMSDAEIAERLKKNPWKIKKDLEELSGVSLERLKFLKEAVLELEWKFKTGELEPHLATEMLLAK
ncbi:MAG: DNA polymerase III subunit delta [Cyanobacteria bacterium]|nr:DNA polymerase III subunit delta [Cyanobacteriota bacterium]